MSFVKGSMKKIIAIAGSPLSLQVSEEFKKQNIEVIEDIEQVEKLLKAGEYTKQLTQILKEDDAIILAERYFADNLTKKQRNAPLTESVRTEPKIHNNDPCPCGSGKKYKKCCK